MVSGYSKYGSIGRYAITLTAPHPMAVAVPPVTALKWVPCASEGGTCVFTGTRQVRYGANEIYAMWKATNSIGCNNSVCGDPIAGVVTSCSYADDGSITSTTLTPTLAPAPAPALRPTLTPALTPTLTPAPTQVWTQCAVENGLCIFAGTHTVRYGSHGFYVTKTAGWPFICNNAAFSSDPLYGVV